MLELLKKIGVPATVAAVIASLVTTVPLLFKIDERYAKSEELMVAAEKSSRQIQDLTVEVSKLAGVQETMLALMMQKERRAEAVQPTTVTVPTTITTPVPVGAAPAMAPIEASPAECARLRAAGFKCMGVDEAASAPRARSAPLLGARPAQPASPPPPTTITQTVQVPVKITPAPKTPEEIKEAEARQKMYDAVGSVLKRSQEQLSAIQKY